MLVVLSEINCLEQIKGQGVYPDLFYTDYNLFKNHAVSFQQADIIVMFVGTCLFNRKLVTETVKNLMKRAENTKDTGIRSITIISDGQHPLINHYYRFVGDFASAVACKGYDEVKGAKPVNVWSAFRSEPKETKIYLSSYDTGNDSKAKEEYEHRFNTEDEYAKLIKVADIKAMLS